MASFNTAVYDITPETYNMSLPTYIDGSNCIAMSGTKWYDGAFGELMCSFAVDGGDSILGGNVIISGDVTCCSKLLVKGVTTFNASPVCSVVPTTANQLVNKTYVDNALSGGGGTQLLPLNNTWTGTNTFNNLPVCSVVPTTSSQLTNKTYVDNAVSGSSSNSLNNRNITNELVGFNNFVFINISTNTIRT